MAEILESYTFAQRGRGSTHPYEEWFDGRIRRLIKGVDFECAPASIRQSVYTAARSRNIKVSTNLLPNALVLQAQKETDEPIK
ncbi:MAG: hypothetical protein CMB22_00275 [Euryarchaeota archaeon]|nr:hypothetical protein [Euryarchaeota archaeon]|tara:strand:+ start:3921 stop:4169 length:249 start_codon:yes stop_codon:yes gene_type:complete